MKITAVVFDMDGLMLDTEPLYKAAWQQSSAELGFDLDDRAYSVMIGRPNEDCERELVKHFGPAFPMPQFRARWPQLWRMAVQDQGIAPKAGLTRLLRLSRSKACPRPSPHRAMPTTRNSACEAPVCQVGSPLSSPGI